MCYYYNILHKCTVYNFRASVKRAFITRFPNVSSAGVYQSDKTFCLTAITLLGVLQYQLNCFARETFLFIFRMGAFILYREKIAIER
jgi:hypothetical protein